MYTRLPAAPSTALDNNSVNRLRENTRLGLVLPPPSIDGAGQFPPHRGSLSLDHNIQNKPIARGNSQETMAPAAAFQAEPPCFPRWRVNVGTNVFLVLQLPLRFQNANRLSSTEFRPARVSRPSARATLLEPSPNPSARTPKTSIGAALLGQRVDLHSVALATLRETCRIWFHHGKIITN